MKALYNYEHSFLPGLILANNTEMANKFYQALISNFESLSLDIINKFSEEEQVSDIVFATAMKSEFKSEELPAKEANGVRYNLLKLYFFFQPNPEFSPLCPYAYVFSTISNGKEVYYYFTVEYDSNIDDGDNRGSYWLCRWVVNSNGKLSHKNYGMVKLDDDVIINKIFDIVVDKKKVNPKASSSNNMSNMRIFPAPPGWQEEMKRREEQYERQKQAEEAGELIEALFAIGFIIYLIYLFCK